MYSHVDANVPAARRATHDADENARVLERFRKKELQVLINVRMLTEGTDIPEVKTVFITRQTTSRILLTQMVGRALRGPTFSGTADAFIVSFEDDWREQIQWAGFELGNGNADDDESKERATRPPLQLISIELVRRLASQMSAGSNVARVPFQTHLPLGWYKTLFDARAPDSEDIEPMDLLVMVYEDERAGFEKLIAHLLKEVPKVLGDEGITLAVHQRRVAKWRAIHLAGASRSPTDLETEIFQLARHIAQRSTTPQFFPFEVRADHDLDVIAARHVQQRIDIVGADTELRQEFARVDRFWGSLFSRYEQFRHFYDGSVARILGGGSGPTAPQPATKAYAPDVVDDATRTKVFARDGRVCLACGATRSSQLDHITSVYHEGSNEIDNLQTLCRQCNVFKATQHISFRVSSTALTQAPATLPDPPLPASADAANAEAWDRYLKRTINFFYQCAAVDQIAIAGRGDGHYNWTVTLCSGNRPGWLKPRLASLLKRIQEVRKAGGKARVRSVRVAAPGYKDVVVSDA